MMTIDYLTSDDGKWIILLSIDYSCLQCRSLIQISCKLKKLYCHQRYRTGLLMVWGPRQLPSLPFYPACVAFVGPDGVLVCSTFRWRMFSILSELVSVSLQTLRHLLALNSRDTEKQHWSHDAHEQCIGTIHTREHTRPLYTCICMKCVTESAILLFFIKKINRPVPGEYVMGL